MPKQSTHAAFLARRRANRRKRHPLPLDASLPGEEWRPVAGYEGTYEVSNLSRIRRIGYAPGAVTGRVLRHRGGGPYPFVGLYVDGRGRKAYVHRLVAEAFIGPIPAGHQVNHIDGNPANAAISNLEIVTPSDNLRHAYRTGLQPPTKAVPRGEASPTSKLTTDQVLEIRAAEGVESANATARRFGISGVQVRNIQTRRQWAHV